MEILNFIMKGVKEFGPAVVFGGAFLFVLFWKFLPYWERREIRETEERNLFIKERSEERQAFLAKLEKLNESIDRVADRLSEFRADVKEDIHRNGAHIESVKVRLDRLIEDRKKVN
jgi:septal ring factor EnvC (AmiA/AmiB activator)